MYNSIEALETDHDLSFPYSVHILYLYNFSISYIIYMKLKNHVVRTIGRDMRKSIRQFPSFL